MNNLFILNIIINTRTKRFVIVLLVFNYFPFYETGDLSDRAAGVSCGCLLWRCTNDSVFSYLAAGGGWGEAMMVGVQSVHCTAGECTVQLTM